MPDPAKVPEPPPPPTAAPRAVARPARPAPAAKPAPASPPAVGLVKPPPALGPGSLHAAVLGLGAREARGLVECLRSHAEKAKPGVQADKAKYSLAQAEAAQDESVRGYAASAVSAVWRAQGGDQHSEAVLRAALEKALAALPAE